MSSLPSSKIYQTPSGQEVEIDLVNPSRFIIANWSRLLPDWQTAPEHLILILQKTTFPLQDLNLQVAQEKKNAERLFSF